MNSPKSNERCSSSLSNGKRTLSTDLKEDSFDNSVKESTKSERNGKEEDWRRRTIIVEKKNGSYGFSLQSYGIHYKKEQELEVITYVDRVDTEGPAAAAGMREGDVILSINGTEVDRAEHASIVKAINASDSRMRMVVIFEDCVRKVELHLKYIHIQKKLESKINEFEKLSFKERQLLDANWKTHSLPSQKKKPATIENDADIEDQLKDNSNLGIKRPTLSSENVTSSQPPPPQNVFFYQYLDPRYGACVIQPHLQAGSFVITVGSPHNTQDYRQYILRPQNDYHRSVHCQNNEHQTTKETKSHKNCYGHGCAPCYYNYDANSLEAYDLASPCCDPNCVPNSKKKVRRKKDCSKEHRKREKSQSEKIKQKYNNGPPVRLKNVCGSNQCNSGNCSSSRYRYLSTESTQTSQCSLQSYATSTATLPGDNSASNYSTSLSSDTLFWDDRPDAKSSPKIQYHSSSKTLKPKSWDNLTTKAFGGYGFGYGYLDTSSKQGQRSKSHNRSHSGRIVHSLQEKHLPQRQNGTSSQVYARSKSQCAPAKSTESLTVLPKCHQESSTSSETKQPCECNDSLQYYRRLKQSRSASRATDHYQQSNILTYCNNIYKKKDTNVSSEITRL